MGTPFQSYWTSLAMWDHTVLPATQHKWTHPPNPSHTGWYSIYLPRRDGRLSWPSWLECRLIIIIIIIRQIMMMMMMICYNWLIDRLIAGVIFSCCSGCRLVIPVSCVRYQCTECTTDFNYCENCFQSRRSHTHPFNKIFDSGELKSSWCDCLSDTVTLNTYSLDYRMMLSVYWTVRLTEYQANGLIIVIYSMPTLEPSSISKPLRSNHWV